MLRRALTKLREAKAHALARRPNEVEFLPAALEIIETAPSPTGRALAYTVMGAATFFSVWAMIGQIDVFATAMGKVVPAGQTKVVQPTETGVVTAILVKNGDRVRVGAPLLELDTTQVGADRDRFGHDLRIAQLEVAKYEALYKVLLTGAPLRLVGPPDATADELVAAQTSMLAESVAGSAGVAEIAQQLSAKNAEIAATESSLLAYQTSLPLVEQQAALREQLVNIRFSNRLSYLQSQQAVVEARRQVAVLSSQRAQAIAERGALARRKEQAVAQYSKALLDGRERAQLQLSQANAELTKAADRFEFKTLKAPVDGSVQDLRVHTIGGVVTPAEPIVSIVPERDELTVEAKVDNQDVGFVRVGQSAQVKIDTFNFTRYGWLNGTVTDLSRDVSSVRDDARPQTAEAPQYVARIKLDRNWIDTDAGRSSLTPGMSARVEIKTGRRRIMDFFLSPLKGKLEESMHER